MLLLAACGSHLAPMQNIALAGPAAGLEKFEGGWFDAEGELIAVVSSGADSRFRLRIAIPTEYLNLTDARLQNGEILFTMKGGGTSNCSIRLLEANVAAAGCGCMGVSLQRDPSSFKLIRWSTRRAARFARKAYEGAFDWLAGVL